MTRLIQRDYRLVIDELDVTGLDITFDVTRTLKKTDNTAEIDIFNLRADHRKQIEDQPFPRVILEAGYKRSPTDPDKSAPMSVIFNGLLRDTNSRREPTGDWITTISSRDGRAQRKKGERQGRIARSFPPGTSITKVVQECARAMGVGVGNLASLRSVEFPRAGAIYSCGTVLSGDAANELDGILRSAGLEYSIQNGVLQILSRAQALNNLAVVLTPETGLLGSPSISSSGVASGECLLIPDLFPGRKIEIRSASVLGFFVMTHCKYRGDTRDNDWTIGFEAKPIDVRAA